MPDFDFDAFNHDNVPSENGESDTPVATANATVNNEKTETAPAPAENANHEDVDKW
jgi:hypothetical protein